MNSFVSFNVILPIPTIASATSTMGILPLKDALVYPYITLASSFKASCLAFKSLVSDLLLRYSFIDSLIITRVSNKSTTSLVSIPSLTLELTNTPPFGLIIRFS
eukprot:NODE_68_length_23780_cov_0.251003.p15 type:complete len:104 gc:universal NODE_68_length_23780_cov_0.251003:13637-13326(-)